MMVGERLAVIWQNDSNEVKLTQIQSSLNKYQTQTLPSDGNKLIAATSNGETFFYLTLDFSIKFAERPATLTLHRYDKDRKYLARKIDTSKGSVNMIASNRSSVGLASLQYSNGTLALIIGRLMHQSTDKLNHQGAIAAVFNATTLELMVNHGQTSGHSFDNYMTVDSAGKFLAIDLGDNYPRGINVHKFDKNGHQHRVAYTFKTKHGQKSVSPAGAEYPVYDEISSAQQTFYKWSNDNNTYTELGSVIEFDDGYTVVFAGEPNLQGKAIDNSRVGGFLTDSRNIGIVKIRKDFENATGFGNVVTDDLVVSDDVAQSIKEDGGFYTFGGTWSQQRNAGLVWLTDYRDGKDTNASRIKAVKLSDREIMVVWEQWSSRAYKETYLMRIDSLGKKLSSFVALGKDVRLHRRDDLLSNNGYTYIVSTSNQHLFVTVINTKIP